MGNTMKSTNLCEPSPLRAAFCFLSILLGLLGGDFASERLEAADIKVINTDDAGAGSLRQAILESNFTIGERDTIRFSIPGAGPHTIVLASDLPQIVDPVTIDGYTQPGASPNTRTSESGSDASLQIVLDGAAAATFGFSIRSGDSVVRGMLIQNFLGSGLLLQIADGNTVEGSWIGLDASGAVAAGNLMGIQILNSGSNTIGGNDPAARNLISGNDLDGISISGVLSQSNEILGNSIGVGASGQSVIGNVRDAIRVDGSPATLIGGVSEGSGNVICGSGVGVRISNPGAIGTIVRGNSIGTDAGGVSGLGNLQAGIVASDGSTATTIGGSDPAAGNIVAFNTEDGVRVVGETTTTAILRNSIHSNGFLGIDLVGVVGVNANDTGDLDTGTNGLQNHPVLTSVVADGDDTLIEGTLNSSATTNFRVEFFASDDCDPSGHGEGKRYLDVANVLSDAAGDATISVRLRGVSIAPNEFVTATATDDGKTSEFSECIQPTVQVSCSLDPSAASAEVGTSHTLTFAVTADGVPRAGVDVGFIVVSGPNVGEAANAVTDVDGVARLTYSNQGAVGRDVIEARGTVDGTAFLCFAAQDWFLPANNPPAAVCLYVRVVAGSACGVQVAPGTFDGGSADPDGDPVTLSVDPPGPYPVGTTPVTVTVRDNRNGVAMCTADITVVDETPPSLGCPSDILVTVPFDVDETVVPFALPVASDNCGGVDIVCEPPSGSLFPLGRTTVTCTATDQHGNSSVCAFDVVVEDEPKPVEELRDLAVIKLKVPKKVKLSRSRSAVTQRIKVTIQNRGGQPERIEDFGTLKNLIIVEAESLGDCPPPDVRVDPKMAKRLPRRLKPKQKFKVTFDVVFFCANDPLQSKKKDPGHEDYLWRAFVNRAVLDGMPDDDLADDVCPHSVNPPFETKRVGNIRDQGCGAKKADGTFGAEVVTDVVNKNAR